MNVSRNDISEENLKTLTIQLLKEIISKVSEIPIKDIKKNYRWIGMDWIHLLF